MTVAELLKDLEFHGLAGDLDETIRWALIELLLRRREELSAINSRVILSAFDLDSSDQKV